MIKVLKTVIIAIIFLTVTVREANAAVLNSLSIKEKIRKEVIEQVSKSIKGQISVEVKNIPFKTVEIPDGKLKIAVTMNNKYFSQDTLVRVGVLVDDQEVRYFGVPVKITVTDNVWVATDNIEKGEALSVNNVVIENQDITMDAENAARSNFNPANILVKRPFRTGEVIDKRYVETIPTVIKNSLVSLIFKTDNLTISVDGEALNDGRMGDIVRVRNKKYQKDYTGKVIGINTVLVNI